MSDEREQRAGEGTRADGGAGSEGQEPLKETGSGGEAYPEPPAAYEASPVHLPGQRTEEPGSATPDTDPEYEPRTLRSQRWEKQAHPATGAYPEPPPAYEGETAEAKAGAQSGEAVGAPAPTPPPPLAREVEGAAKPKEGGKGPVIATVVLLVLLLGGAAAYFLGHRGENVVAGGMLQATPGGLIYENTAQHIRFTSPANWTRYQTANAQVMVRGDGCSFGLLEQRTRLSAEMLAGVEAKELQRRHPEAAPAVTRRSIGGRDAETFSGTYPDSEGQQMTQTYVLIPRDGEVITLIETSTAPGCVTAFSSMEEGLSI